MTCTLVSLSNAPVGEAKIEDADKEDGKEKDTPDEEEDECMSHEDCSGCPYLCPACGECLCEYED